MEVKTPVTELGKLIRKHRCELKMTQKDLAEICGISVSNVKNIESKFCETEFKNKLKLFAALSIDLNAIAKRELSK